MGFNDFILNLKNGKQIDLSKLKGGINIDTVDKKLASIFRALDTNDNGIIENAEIDLLKKYLLKADGDNNKIIDEKELADINKGTVIDTKAVEEKFEKGENVSEEEILL